MSPKDEDEDKNDRRGFLPTEGTDEYKAELAADHIISSIVLYCIAFKTSTYPVSH